jgi:nucleoside-diphosphate-sugar epimerase
MAEPAERDSRVMVTGGAGFLGSHVVAELENRGYQDVGIVRSKDFDLATEHGVAGALRLFEPEIVIHLAALVGGIGANAARPGEFFYTNLVMGAMLMEKARLTGVKKFVAVGTVLRLPEEHSSPLPRGRPMERIPGRDQRSLRPGEEDAPGTKPGLPGAVRFRIDLLAPH